MKAIRYLRYFTYLAANWNLGIALHIIKNEIRGEKKYGINTTGVDELSSLKKMGIDIEHATIYMPASYDILEDIFEWLRPHGLKFLLDLGSGKGRVLCVAADYGFQKIVGLDFSRSLCQAANANLASIKTDHPGIEAQVFHNDAFYFIIPGEVDCLFFFNPFDDVIMSGVIENIRTSLLETPRKLYIVYLNPQHKHLFLEQDFKVIHHIKKMHYLEAVIMVK